MTSKQSARALLRASWFVAALIAVTSAWLIAQRTASAQDPTATARQIQQSLDSTGFCQLGAGTYSIDAPIRLKAGQRLAGVGFATKIVYVGISPWAVVFGEREKPNYACYLDNLSIQGGGVLCESLSQTCAIERVWVSKSRADGLRIEGAGERIVLRDVVSWENAGDGLVVRCPDTNNGILFDHCNAQGNTGHGVRLETAAPNGELLGTVLRDCTIQGNGRGGGAAAEVLIQGYVNVTRIENTWIERSERYSPNMKTGVRTVAASFPGENGAAAVVRRPGRLAIGGASVISLMPRAMEWVDCVDCAIEQLWATPATSKVHWKSGDDGGNSLQATKPRGELWILSPSQLVADPELR